MKVFFAAASAALLSTAFAADFCDQWGTAKTGDYIIYNNLWGKADATSGKQCTGLDNASGSTVSWHTTWTWQGGDKKVKSYANAALEFEAVQLSGIKSIPSTMEYEVSYKGNVVADVAYDLFTTSKPAGENTVKEFEIMIWLAAIGGAGPISSTGSSIDKTTIAGNEFSVYSGPNGDMMVYSFVADKQINSFDGDLMEFFNYLVKSQKFDTKQYLFKVECGTEPFVGTDVKLTVSEYSAAVNTGASGTTGSSATTPAESGDSSSSTESGGQTTTAPTTSSTDSSSSQESPSTPTSSSTSSIDSSSSEETSSTGSSSSEQTPSTPTSSSTTSGDSSSTEETPSADSSSSEQTPSTTTSGDSSQTEEAPGTDSSSNEQQTPTTTTAPTTLMSSSTSSTDSSASEETPSTPTAPSTPSTPSTGSSSQTTPSVTPSPVGQKCNRRMRA
ncbi:hypothetical protein PHYBOEH_006087 [Phytophthora boehmeriae]|uniref:Cell 12A endoglucanase n=1 Tax=Phytophthora boehmeriae TaxID=109152 RepID=A0A8T1WP13_9STRA|nr:hypothetical protein PHYBOEH_006087 [Phytophthora boehmeriae]